MYALF
jgi:E3 ubiquitin-protein ligase HUWE1